MRTSRHIVAPEVPTEPLARSVVIDNSGAAWQRHENGIWVAAVTPGSARWFRWTDLVMHEGPLTLVWEQETP